MAADQGNAAFAAAWITTWTSLGGQIGVTPAGATWLSWPIREVEHRTARTTLLGLLDNAGRDARNRVFSLAADMRKAA